VGRSRPAVAEYLLDLGVPVVTGAANFLLVKPVDRREVVRFVREPGVLVQAVSAKPLAGMFRVSVGTESETDRFRALYSAYHQGN
jgi:histidinol-phosphate/aromatic aminotransferase/cobyric acid decarboxylase-like protein